MSTDIMKALAVYASFDFSVTMVVSSTVTSEILLIGGSMLLNSCLTRPGSLLRSIPCVLELLVGSESV